MNSGTLYILATPIGNLEDMTFRAVRILREVDLIAAEDTRHTRKLLTHFGISKPLTSYFDHNKTLKGTVILEKLKNGFSVALVSDAGTPCISDPGYQLVRDAVADGVPVVPIPGACAAVAALSVSGLPTDAFVFEGFLPNRSGKRREKLALLKDEKRLLIFYEAPTRLMATLGDIAEIVGDRDVVVAREITKLYEELLRGPVSEILETLRERQLKGEIVLLVAPSAEAPPVRENLVTELLQRYLFSDGISVKDAVRKVAEETGVPKGKVYDQALQLKADS
ncbi:MAG: 16S rRNA (cytidine(1402)-2'-O)-methyltransferase [Deltaproteobacteria bacterium]|nr:16S rRNA (cytidine(1402)-2'-O)-methyltransferase [Deltaproteobacteria bacterium]TLN04767.1 MAG: 16S rRNA (cytidine(1402)-2'-O)-methyltransferase [bacterium]